MSKRIARNNAFFLSAARKLNLSASSWRPLDKPEEAILVVANHYASHCDRMERFGGVLASNGITLVTYDMQGWGGSDSYARYIERHNRADISYAIRSEEQMVADFDKLVTKIMQFYSVKGPDNRSQLEKMLREKKNPWDPELPIAPKLPIFVLGHGIGAAIVARYLVDRVQPDSDKRHAVLGSIFAAPWIGELPQISQLQKYSLLRIIAEKYAPLTRVLSSEPNPSDLYEDVSEVIAWDKDPILTKAGIPPVTVRTFERLCKQSNAIIDKVATPSLILTGEKDPLCASSEGNRIADLLPNKDKLVIDIPESRHDLFLSNPDTANFAQGTVVNWILERAAEYVAPEDPLLTMEDTIRRVCILVVFLFYYGSLNQKKKIKNQEYSSRFD